MCKTFDLTNYFETRSLNSYLGTEYKLVFQDSAYAIVSREGKLYYAVHYDPTTVYDTTGSSHDWNFIKYLVQKMSDLHISPPLHQTIDIDTISGVVIYEPEGIPHSIYKQLHENDPGKKYDKEVVRNMMKSSLDKLHQSHYLHGYVNEDMFIFSTEARIMDFRYCASFFNQEHLAKLVKHDYECDSFLEACEFEISSCDSFLDTDIYEAYVTSCEREIQRIERRQNELITQYNLTSYTLSI